MSDIHVAVSGAQDFPGVDGDALARIAAEVLREEGVKGPTELSLVFVEEAEMARLNGVYRGKEGPTDVLSFAIDEPVRAGGGGVAGLVADTAASDPPGEGIPLMLGDIVICPAVAARNAPEHGSSFDAEMALLVVHGVLHLLGMDHEDPAEAEAMEAQERRHLHECLR